MLKYGAKEELCTVTLGKLDYLDSKGCIEFH